MTRRLSRDSAALFALTLLATVGLSVPAQAVPNCSNTTPELDEEVTCTYNAGGFTDITVPAGADYMAIVLKGAGGGGGGGYFNGDIGAAGGSGSQVSASIVVSSITSVRVVLGKGGDGGTGGGGQGIGGGGGGYSAIYEEESRDADDVLAVAGGGGGGGASPNGTSTKTGGSGSASNTAAGGDGVGPGYGAPGDGTGGTGGAGGDGGSWDSDSDGAGGTGGDDDSGEGGAGYGGGEEGDASGLVNGGGGAGGSYVRPALLSGTATYSPNGGSGGPGGDGAAGTSGDNGSVVITFSANPIVPTVSGTPVAQFAEFSYFLPDGRECLSISPKRVQVGTYVELPGVDANCKSMPGSVVDGWTIPVPPGFTGAGSSSLPLSPGHRVQVIESQRFTAVTFDPVLTIEYDANIASDDACTPANLAHASENGRIGYSWVPRVDFAIARAWNQAPCTPEGYELVGWNTAGDGSGQSIELEAQLPADWEASRVNDHRLFAEWSPRL